MSINHPARFIQFFTEGSLKHPVRGRFKDTKMRRGGSDTKPTSEGDPDGRGR